MKLIFKFLALDFYKKRLYAEAIFWLALSRLAVLFLPFRHMARFLGEHMADHSGNPRIDDLRKVRSVVRVVQTAGRHLPWECKCLVQAITGKMMLASRGIKTTLSLGLAKDDQGDLCAHAWLTLGDRVVLGGQIGHYAVVSTFS